jgi:uncharacterized protein with HEPN domain
MKDDAERLRDILEAIRQVEKYAARGRAAFETDELVQVWLTHHLQIIGEAARRLSDDLRRRYPDVPWPQIIAMRNILVHDYFAVDLEEVWSAVERDVPPLKRKIEAILQDLGP